MPTLTRFALTAFAIAFSLFNLSCSQQKSDVKKVLFLAGKPSHAPGHHEHRAGCLLLAQSLEQSGNGFATEVVNVWPESSEAFEGVDAIVIYADAAGKYSKEQYDFLDSKVKAGTGIMFIHYGVHPTKENGEAYFDPWIGGYFETGYSVNPHWSADLTPKAGHPIGNGIDGPILAHDEFYYNIRFPSHESCSDCYALVDSQLEERRVTRYNNLWNELGDRLIGQRVKLMWCRDPKDQGRGAGFTGGHYHRNWAIDDFRMLVLNTIAWVARGEVPENGIRSAPISDAQLNEHLDGVPDAPLTKPTSEEINAMPAMLRPRDPANYNQKEHYKWVEEMAKRQ